MDIVTIALAMVTVTGAIFLTNCVFRARALTSELKQIEVDMLSLIQARSALEQSYSNSDRLPSLVGASWEKDVTGGFEKVTKDTGVTIYRLQYTKSSSQSGKNIGTVNFELELAGDQEALTRSISLLRSYVQAAKIETIDILPGRGKYQGLYTMKLTGVIYYLGETKADAAPK
ncbi:MAG TPA: hypothetical protein GXX30_00120 [Firmicutes bacterium]|nr:hypothetical protein [Candidatus Fermentithermobacillaceae bacterium]